MEKNFVMLVRLFNEECGEVKTRFLDMPVCNMGTGENLFEEIDKALKDRDIPWENFSAFNSDNASVMKGKHNSVLSRIKSCSA